MRVILGRGTLSRRHVPLPGAHYPMIMRTLLFTLCLGLVAVPVLAQNGPREYKVLATSKTSTMEKEMNAAAEAGYAFATVMGGETAFGGAEAVVVMQKDPRPAAKVYKLLATSKTGTFPLPAGSTDAAAIVTLAPGNYTAMVSSQNGTSGIALVEVYQLP